MGEEHQLHTFWQHIRPKRIQASALRLMTTFCLGGLSFLFFIITIITGVLLLFHYEPGENAYVTVARISSIIPYGSLIRGLHYWAAQLMVVTVALHMARVVWHHAYRPPREMNWVIGVMLFLLTLLLDFSGYLLRGDQESLSAATVAMGLLNDLPGGNYLNVIIFGNGLTQGTSITLYVWHAFLLTITAFVLQGWHFWRIQRDGGVRPL